MGSRGSKTKQTKKDATHMKTDFINDFAQRIEEIFLKNVEEDLENYRKQLFELTSMTDCLVEIQDIPTFVSEKESLTNSKSTVEQGHKAITHEPIEKTDLPPNLDADMLTITQINLQTEQLIQMCKLEETKLNKIFEELSTISRKKRYERFRRDCQSLVSIFEQFESSVEQNISRILKRNEMMKQGKRLTYLPSLPDILRYLQVFTQSNQLLTLTTDEPLSFDLYEVQVCILQKSYEIRFQLNQILCDVYIYEEIHYKSDILREGCNTETLGRTTNPRNKTKRNHERRKRRRQRRRKWKRMNRVKTEQDTYRIGSSFEYLTNLVYELKILVEQLKIPPFEERLVKQKNIYK